ncbi:uncharacterized protein LOC107264975 [Cephus cinctus]|uniref:Uncharacterized protein LOC107264975 n=1 Tax=Cephus cinctus TaxID=211228 RepID=A0AAJ7FFJ9_CEPCN|nr:uncharacterized protein LOC107264975 [Cephus cinctus]
MDEIQETILDGRPMSFSSRTKMWGSTLSYAPARSRKTAPRVSPLAKERFTFCSVGCFLILAKADFLSASALRHSEFHHGAGGTIRLRNLPPARRAPVLSAESRMCSVNCS